VASLELDAVDILRRVKICKEDIKNLLLIMATLSLSNHKHKRNNLPSVVA
jgi:hypothetical protein